MDLALNNLQCLICYKNKPNQIKSSHGIFSLKKNNFKIINTKYYNYKRIR